MASQREQKRLQVEVKITLWLQKHAGRYWRIPEIADACNLSNQAVNNALRGMSKRGSVEKEDRVKKHNGKRYPVYTMLQFHAPTCGPSWMCPAPPMLTPDQIKGIRTVLGFTGDVRIKKHLESA